MSAMLNRPSTQLRKQSEYLFQYGRILGRVHSREEKGIWTHLFKEIRHSLSFKEVILADFLQTTISLTHEVRCVVKLALLLF